MCRSELRSRFEAEIAAARQNSVLSAVGAVVFALLAVPTAGFAVLFLLALLFPGISSGAVLFVAAFSAVFLLLGCWRSWRFRQTRFPAVGEKSKWQQFIPEGSWRFRSPIAGSAFWYLVLWTFFVGLPRLTYDLLANLKNVRSCFQSAAVHDVAFQLLASEEREIELTALRLLSENDGELARSALLLLSLAGLMNPL